jgi:hypothetical protein
VVFGQGRYNPSSTEGQRLLAHELAHVAQQTRPDSAGIPLLQRAPEDEKPAPEGKKEEKKGEAADCDPQPVQLGDRDLGFNTFGLTGPTVSQAHVAVGKNPTTHMCMTQVRSEPVLSFVPFKYVKQGDYMNKGNCFCWAMQGSDARCDLAHHSGCF